EQAPVSGRSLDDIKAELNSRIRNGTLDLYIILRPDILEKGSADLYARNTADFAATSDLKRRIGDAVSQLRMTRAGISIDRVRELSRPITLSTTKVSERGEERDTGGGFALAFGVGFLIYITVILYGQMILGAVIEEKNTRISEILFSSVSSLQLMMGKLIGVSLVALTQYAVWGLAIAAIFLYGAATAAAAGFTLPHLPVSLAVYGALFFLVGYFIYSTFYVLVGSMVTSQQEAGQLSMPVILLLVVGFYLAFPVIKNPDSVFSFWVSMVPFFSPVTMLVRISAQTPPIWQILLSLAIGFGFAIGLVWVAARIYRIGMLMYGKRASIPEAWRWLRQS
ncbi:MAG: ABC transporter permease, partial [Pyrinomonadaceae bacterium]